MRNLLIAAIVWVSCANLFGAGNEAPRPNIIIILADDMGYSDAGCFGSEIQTPHLDALAAGGVRFTQFYNTGRCCPTRASLLTGLYPHQADVGHMTGDKTDIEGYRNNLSHKAVTIAEVLRPAGYSTYMTGKWHVTTDEGPRKPKDNWPRQRGFDRFYGTIKGGGSYFDPAMLTRENTPISPDGDPEYQPEHFYYTDAIADQSSRFIREHHDQKGQQPFFMYVAFTSPHWPLHAPEDAIAKYKGKYDAGYESIRQKRYERMKELGLVDPNWELSPAPMRWSEEKDKAWEARCMEVYAAQIDRMDQGIGRIIDALKDTGSFDNTLVMFLQDNGACAEVMGREMHEDRQRASTGPAMKPGSPQLDVFPKFTREGAPIRDGRANMPGAETSYMAYGKNWANVSNTPFREYKHWVHEGGISTPLIAHWPAGISRRGAMEKQPGHLIDIMPTCIELAGAKYPEKVDAGDVPPMVGVSLLPALAGKMLERKSPIFFEHEGNRAVRDENWKLVAKGEDGAWELYDMTSDRSEMHDLAAKEPDRVKKMAAAWQAWAEANHVLPMNPWKKKTTTAAE
jgi:arylsulfatase